MIHTVRPRPLPAAATVPLLLSGLTRAWYRDCRKPASVVNTWHRARGGALRFYRTQVAAETPD